MILQKSTTSNASLSKKLNRKLLIHSLWMINIACVLSVLILVALFYYMLLMKNPFYLSFSTGVALLAILFFLLIKYLLIFIKKIKNEKHANQFDSRNIFHGIFLILNYLILTFGYIALRILSENLDTFIGTFK